MINQKYSHDIETILSHRHDNGADFWTTPDKRLFKGSPFSALNCAFLLLELGMKPTDPILKDIASLFFDTWRDDGRFKVYPKGAIYPCQTAGVASLLCEIGYASDDRIKRHYHICWIFNTLMVAGDVTNFHLEEDQRPNTQIPCLL